MTARATTLSGGAGGIGEYYGEQLAGYYGEGGPAAFWFGKGAARLGLEGVPTKAQITALMDAIDPGTGERLGRAFSKPGKAARPSARGYDLTFTVPKDVSVFWALSSRGTQGEIEEAVNAAATAVLARLDASAPIRARGELVSGVGLAIAVIPEHTSRLGDPSLHVHSVISSKVQHPVSRQWYALDARELKHHQQALSALFHRGLEAELSRRLDLTWGSRKDIKGFTTPLAGAETEVCEVLSQRTEKYKERLAMKLDRFVAELDREPSPQEMWQLDREAAQESRPEKKQIDETIESERWRAVADGITGTEETYTDRVHAVRSEPAEITAEDIRLASETALAELAEKRSTWRRGHLVTEIARNLPSGLNLTASALVGIVDDAADRILLSETIVPVSKSNDDFALTDGTIDVMATFTTANVLAQEVEIASWFDAAMTDGNDSTVAIDVDEHADRQLSEGQSQAAARTAGTGKVELIVGPAGTGKTTALTAAVRSLKLQRRDVFGLATSSNAAGVLGKETGCSVENITVFLREHTERSGGPSAEFDLAKGATLIVDEAGMVSTRHWHELTNLAAKNDWRIVAVGDGYQFSAVGRGGMFDLLCRTAPADRVTHLDRVHRFQHEWEAEASLRLRDGDTSVLDTYAEHERIHRAPTDEIAIKAAATLWIDRLAKTYGRADVGIFATSNSTVAEINRKVQQLRLSHGHLSPANSIRFGADNKKVLYVGDSVVTRRNDRNLVTDQGHWVRNRDRWKVRSVDQASGTVLLEGSTGRVLIPANYLAEHVELGYAQTSHASQGRTVDESILVLGSEDLADRSSIYVPMTRGRRSNDVIAGGTMTTDEAVDRVAKALEQRWIDSPALAQIGSDRKPTGSTDAADPALADLIATALERFTVTAEAHKKSQGDLRSLQGRFKIEKADFDALIENLLEQLGRTRSELRKHLAAKPRVATRKWKQTHESLTETEAALVERQTTMLAEHDALLAPLEQDLKSAKRKEQAASAKFDEARRVLAKLRSRPDPVEPGVERRRRGHEPPQLGL